MRCWRRGYTNEGQVLLSCQKCRAAASWSQTLLKSTLVIQHWLQKSIMQQTWKSKSARALFEYVPTVLDRRQINGKCESCQWYCRIEIWGCQTVLCLCSIRVVIRRKHLLLRIYWWRTVAHIEYMTLCGQPMVNQLYARIAHVRQSISAKYTEYYLCNIWGHAIETIVSLMGKMSGQAACLELKKRSSR